MLHASFLLGVVQSKLFEYQDTANSLSRSVDPLFLTVRPWQDDESFSGSLILDFLAQLGTLYMISPQQLQKFPPMKVPQPGDALGGAGALLADAFKVQKKHFVVLRNRKYILLLANTTSPFFIDIFLFF